jgi:hypothetical protein
MLGTTRYIALIGGGRAPKFPQNKVHIFNDATQAVSTSLELAAPIHRIKISQTHLIVVLLHSVRIYRMALPPALLATYETTANPHGLCALGSSIVAFPGRAVGQVKIYDLGTGNVSIIPASTSPLRALALSSDDAQLATASEAGTLVRLWSFPACTKTGEVRRGVDAAVILGVAFSPSGTAVAVTSDKGTLHIFDLPSGGRSSHESRASEPTPTDHKWRMLSKLPLLPRQFSDTYSNCSTPFSLGDDYTSLDTGLVPGVPGGRPTKGLLGWLDESSVVCIGAGQDARWEKFVVGYDDMGKRAVWREGWRRYLD